MYIETIANRNSPPAVLLREAYREGGKVRKRTLANLGKWPRDLVEGLRTLLKGGRVVAPEVDAVVIRRSLPHGHVAAILGTLRKIGLDRIVAAKGGRRRDLAVAMVCARLIAPMSKLATAKALDRETAGSSLGAVLGLGAVDEDELYAALDWLVERQPAIERALAKRHLAEHTLVLYDVTSSYFEGRCCPLASFGYNRDGKKGKLQIVYGLLCDADGPRWRSRCSRAIPAIRRPWGPRSTSSPALRPPARGAGGRPRHDHRGPRSSEDLRRSRGPGLDHRPAGRTIRGLANGRHCSRRCSTSATWPRSPRRTIPGERLIVCRNPCWPANAAASATNCSPPPRKNLAEIVRR